jgi:hypothetical protein
MGFLAPFWLALVGAAAVPLLLHLLRRRIGKRTEFPAARYLLRAEQEHSAKLRLRNWLLMLLRMLAVLLVALAAARPVGSLGGGGHPPTALAVVLDNSLSSSAVVNGQPALEPLRAAAIQALEAANPADRVWLVTADGQATGGPAAAVVAAARAARPLAGAGDLRAATERALALVRAAGVPSQTVAVLTDAQATSWTGVVDAGPTRLVVSVPTDAPPPNRAVVLAESRPARWTPGGAVALRVASADSAAYRVTLRAPGASARTLARGTAGPGQELTVRATPAERGWTAGAVELEPDELRGDDVRHFAAWVGAAPAATASAGAGPFVASALSTLVASGRVRTGGELSIVSADELTRLPAVIVAPADPARLGAANLALERAGVPWRLGALAVGEAAARFVETSSDSAAGDRVSVTRRYVLAPRGGAADTLALAAGAPWIVAGEGYVLVASPLDPQATTFPLRAAFVPWLADVLGQRLGAGAGAVTLAAPGERVAVPAQVTALEDPSGTRTALGSTAASAPPAPGVYFWLRGGAGADAQRVGALVVNGDSEESVLERLTAREMRGRLSGREVQVQSDARRFSALVYDGAGRRALGGPLLIAALLVLAAEGLLTRRAGRPAAGPATARAA